MKKIFVLVLVFALCLTGCIQGGRVPIDSSSEPIAPSVPENPGSGLIEYDPDREIYFSCRNLDYDIYLDMSGAPFISFWILSKEALNIETLQADIPIQNGYSILYAECCDESLGQLSIDDSVENISVFKPYLYQCYLGIPWSDDNSDAATIKTEDGKAYAFAEAYGLLEPEDLPQFHAYHVVIMFEKTVGGEESFQEMTLTIDGKTYPIQIGEIRLHEEAALNHPIDWVLDDGGVTSQTIIPYCYTMLYNDGIGQIAPAFDFTAAYDMELLDMHLLDPNIEILDVRLVVSSKKGTVMDFYWDKKSTVYIESGDHVQIFVYYRDERQTELDYEAKAWPVIDYKCELGYYSAFTECTLTRELNLYELYAIVFDGVDMESYYRDYYFPKYESWRQDYAS